MIAIAAATSSGCGPDSSAAGQEVLQQVESHRHSSDPRVEAIKPMLGRWVVDMNETLRENAGLGEDALALIRKDLEFNPFELQITDREYISHSWSQTISDRYTVVRADGNVVIIKLQSPERDEPGDERDKRLQILDGRLLIRDAGLMIAADTFTCVMSRPAKGE